jgi:hypothetical protein
MSYTAPDFADDCMSAADVYGAPKTMPSDDNMDDLHALAERITLALAQRRELLDVLRTIYFAEFGSLRVTCAGTYWEQAQHLLRKAGVK